MSDGISVEIVGLRDAQGRFARMVDGELVAYQTEQAELLAHDIADAYKTYAPRSTEPQAGPADGPFAESFSGKAEPSASGFLLEVSTGKPDLRRWLKEGTGIFGPVGKPIVPKKDGGLLHFFAYGEEWFLRSVQGMKPNPWEDKVDAVVGPMTELFGNKIGNHVVDKLAGKA